MWVEIKNHLVLLSKLISVSKVGRRLILEFDENGGITIEFSSEEDALAAYEKLKAILEVEEL